MHAHRHLVADEVGNVTVLVPDTEVLAVESRRRVEADARALALLADGVLVLMVCKRTEVSKPELSAAAQRDRIANRLIDERLGLAARQHLRDLRRAAFVDIRL